MNARIRFAVLLATGLAASAAAMAQAIPAVATDAMPRSLVVASLRSAAPDRRPHDRPTGYAQPCSTSTFSELGHGHAAVADAGYASAHCPHYDQHADAGDPGRF